MVQITNTIFLFFPNMIVYNTNPREFDWESSNSISPVKFPWICVLHNGEIQEHGICIWTDSFSLSLKLHQIYIMNLKIYNILTPSIYIFYRIFYCCFVAINCSFALCVDPSNYIGFVMIYNLKFNVSLLREFG